VTKTKRVSRDRYFAAICSVTAGHLNEAIKRNAMPFQEDFMFQFSREETERSRSQNAILNSGRGSNMTVLRQADR
jgi:ORF6N domain